ncbi:hypothetical protein K439DRAFT_453233 [Ramaria rubella]|nr:hypothetical protein K439DRAFT_453233 [Ramaria rubella]
MPHECYIHDLETGSPCTELLSSWLLLLRCTWLFLGWQELLSVFFLVFLKLRLRRSFSFKELFQGNV